MTVEQHQLDILARSKTAVDRARLYRNRLADHAGDLAAEIKARRTARVFEGNDAVADDALATRRDEHAAIIKQRDLAAEALSAAEAEHARHFADLDALLGDDGEARASLAHAHSVRADAQVAADDAKAVLDRATSYAETIENRLHEAQSADRERDQAAVGRLHAALLNGEAPASAEAPAQRTTAILEHDLRTARLAIETLADQHRKRLDDLAAAERAVSAAVDGVLLVEADRVARELEAAETRAAMLRRRLVSYTERRPAGFVAPAPINGSLRQHPEGYFVRDPEPVVTPASVSQSNLIRKLVAMPSPERNGPDVENWRQEADAWAAFAGALTDTATAEPAFAIEPAYTPSLVRPVASITPPSSLPNFAAVNRAIRDRRPTPQGRFVA